MKLRPGGALATQRWIVADMLPGDIRWRVPGDLFYLEHGIAHGNIEASAAH